MLYLDNGLPLPVPLAPDIPAPTSAQILMSVPPWVGYVLKHKTNNDPHYEHTLYPPWTTFLVEVFPARRYFYIRPQGLVRRVVEAEELADADTSIGSFGSRHEARISVCALSYHFYSSSF